MSLEMTFYRKTWAKMDKFTEIIARVPSTHTKLGTILLETLTLKKQLNEKPK